MESLLEEGGPIVAGILVFAYAYRIVASVHQGRTTDQPRGNRPPEAADDPPDAEDGAAPKADDGRLIQFGYRVWLLFRGRRRR